MFRLLSRLGPGLIHAATRRSPHRRLSRLRRILPSIEPMEPRILHALDHPLLQGGDGSAPAEAVAPPPAVTVPAPAVVSQATSTSPQADAATQQSAGSQLLIIDTRVDGWQDLAHDALATHPDGSVEVAVLDLERDGIDQIDALLAAHTGLASVHIVSTGTEGAVLLGDSVVDAALLASRATDIAAWRNALVPGGDLLLYGCDVALDADGAAFVDLLASEAGVDVAASTDRTGAAARSGDWTLEYQRGEVETPVLFSPLAQAGWTGVMDAFVVTSTANGGAGSFRQAIIDANAHGGTDSITFSIGSGAQSIALGSALPTITDTVLIDGTSQSGYVSTPLIELNGTNAGSNSDGLTFGSGADDSSVSGLVINRFEAVGIHVNGAQNVTVSGNWIGLDATGTLGQGNATGGIGITSAVDTVVANNVVSGNGAQGIWFSGSSSDGTVIRGNSIGTNAAGTAAIGNTKGIYLTSTSNVTVGGSLAGQGNLISGNSDYGLVIEAGGSNSVLNNVIGLNANATAALGNGLGGIRLLASTTGNSILDNLISGNTGSGVDLRDSGTTGNLIRGNTIGSNSLAAALGNGDDGIRIEVGAGGNSIGGTVAGQGNTIVFNAGHGVVIYAGGTASTANSILGNLISANTGLQIDLGNNGVSANDGATSGSQANLGMDTPVVTGAVIAGTSLALTGYVGSAANQSLFANSRVEFFKSSNDGSGHGGSTTYLGFATTDANGNFSTTLTTSAVTSADTVTATATRTSNTSEFAANVAVVVAPPVITSDGGGATATRSVAENSTAVTTVTATDADAGATLTYSIAGGADAARFAINASTGVLRFVAAPDFEAPGSAASSNAYAVTVQVSNGITTDSQALTVSVTNVNEAPAITSNGGAATASVVTPENSTAVTTVTASDPDAATTLTYSISGGADAAKFSINASTGALRFTTAPDFEAPASASSSNTYSVTVQASDGSLTSTQTITVGVTDVNEAPTITSNGGASTANIGVPENSTAVTTVTATDPDAGTTLVYSIGGGADSAKFSIDAATGVLRFVTAPDFEAPGSAAGTNSYRVTVRATDGALATTQALTVGVTNVNEAPAITSNGGGSNASVGVAENSTAVTTVVAADPDAGTTLVYSIGGGADASRFSINASTGALQFITAPNFEAPGSAAASNSYSVTVQASDGSLVSTQAITVGVTDLNEAPTITSNGGASTASIGVPENSTAVTTVTATDPDANTTLAYSISGGADAAKFSINVSTGALNFIAAPNFEAPGSAANSNAYSVTVQASDGSLLRTQAISVVVTNVNEAPTVTSNGGAPTASVSVAENSTAVTTVVATDPDAATTLGYAISGGADAATFAIDASTGALRFVTAPNFEAPGSAAHSNSYDVTVQASDGSLAITQVITVVVTDVNEAPGITSNGGGPVASVSVPENSTAVTTVTATDPDAGAALVYSIGGGADASKFSIDASTGTLRFVTAPDFDLPGSAAHSNSYSLIVQASDGSLVGTQAMTVAVTNVNEPPAIGSNGGGPTASVGVPENSTAVTNVVASDPDAATTLVYSISGGADAAQFAIDASTGALRFVAAPDFEVPGSAADSNVYSVTVQASDGSLSATQALTVAVGNVNEAPTITSNGGAAAAGVDIRENSTAVTTVTAIDPDAGTTLVYSISGGADASKFAIDASTGALQFITAPDFDVPGSAARSNHYSVTVQASDGSLVSTQALTVGVTNVDEAPAITSNGGGSTASVGMPENSTAVTTVVAADPDAGTTLVYSISGGADAAKFSIDASTGALRFVVAPDFEAPGSAAHSNRYGVTVQVSDGALVSSQAIGVDVADVNEAPAITSNGSGSTASVGIPENSTAVTTVTATDPDAGTALVYSISGGADAARFSIDASTGALRFAAAPNFEAPGSAANSNTYRVTVQASDGALASTQAITVGVTDVDEAPVITSNGGGSTAGVGMPENSTAVTTVTATDPDAGTTLVYSISGGADAAKFSIDASTGALRFLAAPDFEAPGSAAGSNRYGVTVQASDGALVGTQALTVDVTDVNEAPALTSNGGGPTASVDIPENSTAVTTVTATDPDAATTLTFSIGGGADARLFSIDAATGALRFITPPDFETPASAAGSDRYSVTVQASDGSLVSTQTITVGVTDVGEAPAITSNGGSPTATVDIPENSTAVTTVTATDPDAGTTLGYSISGGPDAALFTIDASTGALRFVAAPDFEAPGSRAGTDTYDLTVQVTDGALTCNQAISVRVTDVDEAPVITTDGGAAAVARDVPENSLAVATVHATDPDAGTTLTYSISGADAASFSIDAQTGQLHFRKPPDFESPGSVAGTNTYGVTVTVSDGTLDATQAFTITLLDVDEPPVITSHGGDSTAGISIIENSVAVTTVTATDPDAGARLVYSIAGGADAALFTIDAATGDVRFITAPHYATPLDSHGDNLYDVLVQASDGSLAATQHIVVSVVADAPIASAPVAPPRTDGGPLSDLPTAPVAPPIVVTPTVPAIAPIGAGSAGDRGAGSTPLQAAIGRTDLPDASDLPGAIGDDRFEALRGRITLHGEPPTTAAVREARARGALVELVIGQPLLDRTTLTIDGVPDAATDPGTNPTFNGLAEERGSSRSAARHRLVEEEAARAASEEDARTRIQTQDVIAATEGVAASLTLLWSMTQFASLGLGLLGTRANLRAWDPLPVLTRRQDGLIRDKGVSSGSASPWLEPLNEEALLVSNRTPP